MEVFLGERRPQAFRERCRESLAEAKGILDGIMGHRGSRGPADTLLPLNRLSMLVGNLWNVISLLRSVHPAAEVRAAAEESEKEVARFDNELSLNRGLYEAVSRCDASSLDPAGRRMLRHVLRDFHRAGVDRDDATRERVRALREELVAIGQEFLRNISSDVRAVELDGPAELEGLPEDYIHKHRPGLDGRIRITTDYPDYNPYMSYARSSRRRRELYVEFRKRACPANVDVLGSLIRKRHELAALLGYPSWAAYAVEDKMIKTPEAIAGFIERVSGIAAARACEEYAALLAEKRRHEAAAEEVHDWEKSFYEEVLRVECFRIDSRELRPYLSYGAIKDGILAMAADLFGIEFRPAPAARRWHPDVEVLDVYEGTSR
ncbi:MAG: peptidase M3, partial [Planctomycetes bacterium]|nr:peptidase M3 [Planctomycetota bacterium]